jgi:hypothetical protein
MDYRYICLCGHGKHKHKPWPDGYGYCEACLCDIYRPQES